MDPSDSDSGCDCLEVLEELIKKAKQGEMELMPPSCEKKECEDLYQEGASVMCGLLLEKIDREKED